MQILFSLFIVQRHLLQSRLVQLNNSSFGTRKTDTVTFDLFVLLQSH